MNWLVLYDKFGEQYGWSPSVVDELPIETVQCLAFLIDMKHKRTEEEMMQVARR